MTEMSEEAVSIRITCSETSSLGSRGGVMSFDSCCFFFVNVDSPPNTDLDCAVTETMEGVFILASSDGDLTLSVIPLFLTG